LKFFSQLCLCILFAFIHLVYDFTEVVREAMGEEGCIEHLFKIMTKFEDSSALQIVACSALTNLSFDSGQYNFLQ
jgi:hypothetical protein